MQTKKKVNICGGELAAPVNCNDPEEMIRVGIHPPKLRIDFNQFKKTSSEIELLKKHRRTQGLSGGKSVHIKNGSPKGRVLIHIVNEKKLNTFKTVYNYKCKESEISSIKDIFHSNDRISKVKFSKKGI